METPVFDAARAFGATDRLLGVGAYARLAAAHLVVVGVGGVGSWAAEALARAGVGTLTLVDLDQVAESNVNRQILALTNTVGQAKVDALRARIALINPTCVVHCVEAFVEAENPGAHLPAKPDFVLDCIDAARVKVALITYCREHQIPLVVCGAAGGKLDATQLRELDLASATHDSLLASVRAQLRKKHSLSNDRKLNVRCVSSDEPRVGAAPSAHAGAALACAGYGSLVTVTASMGMIAAGIAIREITRAKMCAPATKPQHA